MKRILLICLLIYPLSAHATPTRISTQECTAILDTFRNQIETIFLIEMTLAQFPRKAADVDGALSQVRDQLSDALAHYDSSVTRRGAHILGEKCLGNTDVSAADR